MKPIIALVALVGLVGCGTIDQVPLVYVSSMKVGINVASGTADSPGAKLSIGYDGTDAAYVPIAYGRTCTISAADDCTGAAISSILGSNSISPTEFVASARRQADLMKRDLADIGRLQGLHADALTRQAESQRAVDAVAHDRIRLGMLRAAPVVMAADGSTPVVDPEIGIIENRLARDDSARSLVDATAKVAIAQTSLDQAVATMEHNRQQLIDVLRQNPAQIGARSDALSVYGSFDSGTKVEGEVEGVNGSLNLGKSFSTGVAAQILTEGINRAAATRAVTDCLIAATTLATTGGTVDPVAAAKFASLCGKLE